MARSNPVEKGRFFAPLLILPVISDFVLVGRYQGWFIHFFTGWLSGFSLVSEARGGSRLAQNEPFRQVNLLTSVAVRRAYLLGFRDIHEVFMIASARFYFIRGG